MGASRHRQLVSKGSRAPDFRLPRLDGSETALSELLANGPALLAFFKISCPVCQLTFPFLDRIHAAGLSIFGISQNDPEDTRDFVRRYGISFPILLDSEDEGFAASNAYGISSVPTMFLVERDGVVSNVMLGWSRQDMADLGGKTGADPFRPGEYVPEWKAG